MRVEDTILDDGEAVYHSAAFRVMIESHLDYLRRNSQTSLVAVDPRKAEVYTGDFYGYLIESAVPLKYHWTYLRLNNMLSSAEFGPEFTTLLWPAHRLIERLKTSHLSTGIIRV